MSQPRSPIFDGVDPDLLALIQRVAKTYGPYAVNITSGKRSGTRPSFHNTGGALDVQLSDRKTGQALANYQDPTHARAYQELANAVYRQASSNPDLAKKLRWGGYFGGQKGDYGALDLMHFDLGGGAGGLGMKGGSWAGGWTPEMQKYWGLAAGGGAGDGATPTRPGAITPEQARRAFLATLSSGESPGYDVIYGGGKFTDYSKHPGQSVTAAGRTSDAAGKYQFLGSTWAEQAAKHGYKDFSPETQDTAAWNYAAERYKTATGRDMAADLAERDPALWNQIGASLSGLWPSLPGGSQESPHWKKQGLDFATYYNNQLGGDAPETTPPATSPKPDPAVAAVPSAGGFFSKPSTGDAVSDAVKSLGKFAGGADIGAHSGATASGTGLIPMPLQAPGPITPIVDPARINEQRQQLAMAMQRLNTGRIF